MLLMDASSADRPSSRTQFPAIRGINSNGVSTLNDAVEDRSFWSGNNLHMAESAGDQSLGASSRRAIGFCRWRNASATSLGEVLEDLFR